MNVVVNNDRGGWQPRREADSVGCPSPSACRRVRAGCGERVAGHVPGARALARPQRARELQQPAAGRRQGPAPLHGRAGADAVRLGVSAEAYVHCSCTYPVVSSACRASCRLCPCSVALDDLKPRRVISHQQRRTSAAQTRCCRAAAARGDRACLTGQPDAALVAS